MRLPEKDRVLSTLDSLKVRTENGLVPLSNFITRTPVRQLSQIDRFNQTRFFDIKAAVAEGLTRTVDRDDGTEQTVPINANERIERLTEWLDSGVVPAGISYEWTGDAEEQAESGAFLQKAFAGALGLMFIILLAQFNSVYNAVLVLLAVVLSTTGVLIGMLVMNQPFSIIMTGTGIVALAGIVVNNNIVLIDTYQDYARYMPRIAAITRTAQDRIRPVLLTTITTMAGLAPMMFGLSLDFFNGGYSFDSPTALWWKQLATAVVFGLGIATVLTLVFTPAMLALRVWAGTYLSGPPGCWRCCPWAGRAGRRRTGRSPMRPGGCGMTRSSGRMKTRRRQLSRRRLRPGASQIDDLKSVPCVTANPTPAARGRVMGWNAAAEVRCHPGLLARVSRQVSRLRRITTSTALILAPSGARGRRAISRSSAGASLSRFSSSQ